MDVPEDEGVVETSVEIDQLVAEAVQAIESWIEGS